MTQRLSVWAPRAGSVAADLGDRTVMMAPGERPGWFEIEVPAGEIDYAFRLDGGEPLPDPRSPWQPDGVHGPSRTFDASAFNWTDAGFGPVPLERAVIYELHVGTFSPEGTFAGVVPLLPHLVELGVTHVELLPVNAFAGRWGWGYDGVDLYAPHPAYGTPADLQAVVDACHGHGLAVLLDVVYNHLGPEGNYLSRFGPYFTDRYRTPWGDAINVDGPDSDEVRRFIVDNAARWLVDFRIDGLRLDATHAIIDTSAVHLLEELGEMVLNVSGATRRVKVLTAECEGNDPRLVRHQPEGYSLSAVWNDDLHHALHTALTGERASYYEDYEGVADLLRCWCDGFAFTGRWSPYRRRTIGRRPDGLRPLRGDQLVACLQNHDQVGNRANGERIAALTSLAHQQVAAALLLTGPFVPLLFQGEEWAASTPFPYFADHEGELAEAVRRGRLAEFAAFGWDPAAVTDPEAEATFTAAKLRWDERTRAPHAEMLAWYRSLLALRAARPDLRDPALPTAEPSWDPGTGVLVLRRGGSIVLACLADEPVDVPLGPGSVRIVAASNPGVHRNGSVMHLGPWSVAIVDDLSEAAAARPGAERHEGTT
jgi:maltooligosyltrehalose trehalohydrolase